MPGTLVVIPTYNEQANIVDMIAAMLQSAACISLLIIDDNSPDGTALDVERLMPTYNGRLFLQKRSGKLGLALLILQDLNGLWNITMIIS